ncbi:ribosome maturation factor RimM [Endozoicomonas sp. OPT23]|uniref:ribosome maturation factor RimM n=1 Tax=Endozoicomonas sp. OPT23 TaxID=2072845 RepID=UPI001D9D7F1E|nr:ribosome maturation factor RimM [Endozoicomonas sp. OPT23]
MSNTSAGAQSNQVVLGSITGVYGVKGWVKVYSHTEPMTNILNYKHWILRQNGRQQTIEVSQGRRQGKGLVAQIAGCDDRDIARQYTGAEILIAESELPSLADDEIYWHQLEGLEVRCSFEGADEVLLGKASHLMETGANDVLIIKACKGSIDRRERMVPWLLDRVVLEVNPAEGFIRVDWDPEF